ncbi:MAG: glycine--tRNA ligase [Candidatus Abawacabacteria bacterium RIFCSPHIGHO2_01_FULL_46_8]|uniref:Glycine--tRNA ligase n=1 Tax=Candidatus Abawacabacteria bacterium RIFCSPHIGHO2_01_FULL_46_8 TaxID=1817815 RepID=A0A1F4XJR2_9BACT|nr:MAG: glycine--tRNA ligase [Candidatus Abawacabacteria bacterium RIFCSPHIGHO2_01_FULL_46_8]
MEKIISLCKRRGFIFPSSEIYGGLASSYDYGPLGVELKNNIKQEWWRTMVWQRRDLVGLDAAILMHPKVWEASGHVESFVDPLVDCLDCKLRHRADELLAEQAGVNADKLTTVELNKLLAEHPEVKCPSCGGKLSEARTFNILMETYLGVVKDEKSICYLRGETCQGIYVNFLNVINASRVKIPFGIAQIGKAFRNEITPGHFTFRTREFEQMEMQYFVQPAAAAKVYEEWKQARIEWYKNLGMQAKKMRFNEHKKLAHYAKAAFDIEYETPIGWKEMEGIHNRGDWDLSRHSKFSGEDLSYFDQESGERYTPYIVETSAGADRSALFFLLDAYAEEEVESAKGEKETRVVLRLHHKLAPIKVAVLPLSKKEELSAKALAVWDLLKLNWHTEYDETQSIGKRYRRQDEIGTPFCVTVDFESLTDGAVTVRERDSMKQDRVAIKELVDYLREKLAL